MCLKCASFPWVRGPLARVLMEASRNIETRQHAIGGRFQIRPSRSHSLDARASGPRADNDQVCCAYFIFESTAKTHHGVHRARRASTICE